MADFGEFFRRAFTVPGTGGNEAAVLNELSRARTTAEETLRQQQDLMRRAQQNTLLPEDSEAARLAADARLRRLQGSGFAKNFMIPGMQAAPAGSLAFKSLFGQ